MLRVRERQPLQLQASTQSQIERAHPKSPDSAVSQRIIDQCEADGAKSAPVKNKEPRQGPDLAKLNFRKGGQIMNTRALSQKQNKTASRHSTAQHSTGPVGMMTWVLVLA
jgi:hypothetical protein